MRSRGINKRPQKIVIYGVGGVGKTTLLAQFPGVHIIDTEGGTDQLDVSRDKVSSIEEAEEALATLPPCQTLGIDTFDWLDRMIQARITRKAKADSIEDVGGGYKVGYTKAMEQASQFLAKLDLLLAQGINVVLLCHANIEKFELPDQQGAFDRWEMDISKKTRKLIQEWADVVLFANYYVTVEKPAQSKLGRGKYKAVGGTERVLFTTHTATHFAKNRFGLDPIIPMDFGELSPHIFWGDAVKPEVMDAVSQATKVDPLPEPDDDAAKKVHLAANGPKVNAYLVQIGYLEEGQTWLDLPGEKMDYVMRRFDAFCKKAGI